MKEMIYSYRLWQYDQDNTGKIKTEQVLAVPTWAKLNTAEIEASYNRYDARKEYNFWAYSDKPLNKNKLMSLFRQLKKIGMSARVLDLGAYYA